MLMQIDWLSTDELKKFNELIDGYNDVNFHFESTNEDTWIHKIGDFYYIETCNNEGWGKLYDERNEVPENLKDKIDYEYSELEYLDDSIYEDDFCSLPFNGHFIKRETWDNKVKWDERYCKEHHKEMYKVMGKYMCPICGDLTVVERKEKLKNIFKK